MLEIHEKDVKNALLNGEEELEIIHKRVLALYDELLNTASKIRSISLRSPCFSGRIQTGSYINKDGAKVYTTEVIVEEQEFAESRSEQNSRGGMQNQADQGDGFMNIPDGIDEELPFN